MANNKATLKDIAAVLDVSATTVHRALNGKPGISPQLRERIQNLAAEMGYQTNLAASALKRKHLRICVLLPEPLLENRYYYAALWSGIYQFMEEQGNFNVALTEHFYPILPEAHGRELQKLYESGLQDMDGLITLGTAENQSSYFIEKISQAGIPCVILGSDLYKGSRLCCVKACDEIVGSLAAELFTAFLPEGFQGTVLLSGNPSGQTAMVDQYHNLAAFQNYLVSCSSRLTLQTAYCARTEQLDALLAPFLDSKKALPFGIYASSARHTIKICQILEQYNLSGKIRLIGNDLFPESAEYIRRGVLTAVIDKKVSLQAYRAASLLLDYLALGQYPSQDVIQIPPRVQMKSNLMM